MAGTQPLPGLTAEGLTWNEVPFNRLASTIVEPGMLVTGFPHLRDFTSLEERICYRLTPDSKISDVMSGAIWRNRLGSLVTPRYAVARASSIQAMLFPFDLNRVRRYPGVGNMPRGSDIKGMTALCMADIVSRGEQVTLAHEVSYYATANTTKTAAVRRVEAWATATAANRLLADIWSDSRRIARMVARNALADIIYSPSQGVGGKSGRR